MSVTASFRFGFEGMSPGQILYGAVLLDERQDPSVCGKQMRRTAERFSGSWFCRSGAPERFVSFLDSSMVEHAAVNRGVVGSSPTRGGEETAAEAAASSEEPQSGSS